MRGSGKRSKPAAAAALKRLLCRARAGVEGRALARSLAHAPGGIQQPSNGSQPTAAAQVPSSCAQGSTARQAAQEPTLQQLRRQAKQPTWAGSWPIARPAGGQKLANGHHVVSPARLEIEGPVCMFTSSSHFFFETNQVGELPIILKRKK